MGARIRKSFLLKFMLSCGSGLLVLILLEGGLRLAGFGSQYEFIISGTRPQDEGKLSLNSQYVALHYFQHLPVDLNRLFTDRPWFEDTEFHRAKQPGVYRIFMVGASTTRGFPYTGRTISYSGLLQLILRDVLPSQRVEVVNAGYDALSSFGVLDLTSQILEYQPDLVVVYTGHNEFIGHFGVNSAINYGQNRNVIRLVTFLFHSRVYQAMERTAVKLRSFNLADPSRRSQVNLFRSMLSEQNMTWNESQHRVAERNYEENLKELIRQARSKNVGVVLLTLVSNLRDFSPVRTGFSEDIDPERKQNLLEELKRGKEALDRGKYAEAVERFQHVVGQDPRYADAHFGLGRAFDHLEDWERAKAHYLLAREHDRLHLRACLKFNRIIEQVGAEEQVPVLDLVTEFERASPEGLVGEDLFLEHVHPNINGHLVIADSIARFLREKGYIRPRKEWEWQRLKQAREYVLRTGFDQAQYLNAQYTIGRLYLDFPFYKCDEGISILQNIGRVREEQDLINRCFRITGKDIRIHAD